MTTSDDDPGSARQDALAETTHADPLYAEGDATAVYADAEPKARWPLAILAGIGTLLAGFVVWSLVYIIGGKEYVGVAVVVGLVVGWALRVVSRRSTIPVRVVAVLLTAVACVYGPLVASAAFSAVELDEGFFDIFGRAFPNAFTVLGNQPWQVKLIFVAALVLAWMSASPQKPKQPKKAKRGATMSQGVPPASDDPPPSPVMPAE